MTSKATKALDYYQKVCLHAEQTICNGSKKSYANGDMSYWYYISFFESGYRHQKKQMPVYQCL
jgi:hypothetical protein